MTTRTSESIFQPDMTEDAFFDANRRLLSQGQAELSRAMRQLVSRTAPELAAPAARAPDSVFLEPLLFSYFSDPQPSLGLAQLLYGRWPRELQPEGAAIQSDSRGRFELPGIGLLCTDRPSSRATLARDGAGYRVEIDGQRVAFELRASKFVPGSRLEILNHGSRMLERHFVDTRGRSAAADLEGHGAAHASHLAQALSWLRSCGLDYYRLVAEATRQLCVFRAREVNCFASINVHGTAFFNVEPGHDAVFFFDEIVHQCGHVVFNAVSVRRRDFLALDPETPLARFSPHEAEERTIYDGLHGLYTELMMSRWMAALLRSKLVTDPRQRHELWGRLCFIVRKYCADLANMGHREIFTPLGARLYDYLRRACIRLVEARPALLNASLQGQPYNFDYATFARHNPVVPPDLGAAVGTAAASAVARQGRA